LIGLQLAVIGKANTCVMSGLVCFHFVAEEGGANNWDSLNNRLTLVFIPHLDVGEQTNTTLLLGANKFFHLDPLWFTPIFRVFFFKEMAENPKKKLKLKLK
jgi:hypothetical protein